MFIKLKIKLRIVGLRVIDGFAFIVRLYRYAELKHWSAAVMRYACVSDSRMWAGISVTSYGWLCNRFWKFLFPIYLVPFVCDIFWPLEGPIRGTCAYALNAQNSEKSRVACLEPKDSRISGYNLVSLLYSYILLWFFVLMFLGCTKIFRFVWMRVWLKLKTWCLSDVLFRLGFRLISIFRGKLIAHS